MGLGKKSITINGAECGIESVVLGIVTCIGGFLFGYDTGQISGMLIFRDFRVRFGQGTPQNPYLDTEISSIVVSLMSIGSLIGALFGAYTVDWWGRRRSLSFGVAVFIVGNIIQITAMTTWVHMMMGRFVAGIGVGNLSVGVPMFQSECLPRQIRGPVVASYQLFITVGILISNLVNFGVREIEESSASWRIVIGLGIAFSLPLGIGILFSPESPRWLAGRGRWEEARMSMARFRGMKDDPNCPLVEEDLQEMSSSLAEQSKAGVGSWWECFTGRPSHLPRLVYRTFLGAAIHFLQQWTGVNYFFYYGATIFESAGISDPILVQLILGAVNVVLTFPGLYLVERVGRRIPLIVGAIWQAFWLLIFASVGTALPPQDNPIAGKVMIASACMFIASFAMTWGPFAWVVIGETFPLRTRAKQASLATASNWLGNFMIGFLSPYADAGIQYAFGYVFFGMNLTAAVLVYFFLYETKSLSLENVDAMYSDMSVSARQSKSWVPEGYIDRNRRDSAYWNRRPSARDNARSMSVDEYREDGSSSPGEKVEKGF
ncbi:hexose transporter hxt5 [Saxophila tyrrhenica]|uniref:Hexose transporter hxt5 n=1 Tax=Saxophila tyrrhenica TaxID=1690608 RepID=A0AAV9P780_9PEZI|nr:hexose transporter hxt5 [Saxophila tyrrhenica]